MELDTERAMPVAEASVEFDLFFRAHFPEVSRAAALVARDPDAGQDAAQEAFTRLFLRWSEMESMEHARNFAYKVATNLARSHVRRHLRLSLFGLRGPTEPARPDPAAISVDWIVVTEALGALSARQRACVVLVDYADMDAESAARVLGTRAGTVRVHLMRGRRALREHLGLVSKEA